MGEQSKKGATLTPMYIIYIWIHFTGCFFFVVFFFGIYVVWFACDVCDVH